MDWKGIIVLLYEGIRAYLNWESCQNLWNSMSYRAKKVRILYILFIILIIQLNLNDFNSFLLASFFDNICWRYIFNQSLSFELLSKCFIISLIPYNPILKIYTCSFVWFSVSFERLSRNLIFITCKFLPFF